ncbi:MAG: SMC-Scp complex subunit ScpB [Chthoniobacterales bacterium]
MVSLKQILESVLFCSNKPLPPKAFQAVFKSAVDAAKEEDPLPAEFVKVKEPQIVEALQALQKEYAEGERGMTLVDTASGWQLVTNPECGSWVRHLFPEMKPARLSSPALETLAIIAYRQPITRADIEAVRGVAVDGVMQTILDRGLVKIAGRAEVPGRPLLYETTQFFMEHFGLRNLDELPDAHELRTIPLPKAPIPVEAEKPAEGEAAVAEGETPAEAAAEEHHLLEGEDVTAPETSEDAAQAHDLAEQTVEETEETSVVEEGEAEETAPEVTETADE